MELGPCTCGSGEHNRQAESEEFREVRQSQIAAARQRRREFLIEVWASWSWPEDFESTVRLRGGIYLGELSADYPDQRFNPESARIRSSRWYFCCGTCFGWIASEHKQPDWALYLFPLLIGRTADWHDGAKKCANFLGPCRCVVHFPTRWESREAYDWWLTADEAEVEFELLRPWQLTTFGKLLLDTWEKAKTPLAPWQQRLLVERRRTSESLSVAAMEQPRPGPSIATDLDTLNKFRQSGVLTDEEFNVAKRRLLGLDKSSE